MIIIEFITKVLDIIIGCMNVYEEIRKYIKGEAKFIKRFDKENTNFPMNIVDDEFYEKFVIPDFKEKLFYERSGIYTNVKSIQMYCDLKDRLGRNFTWNSVRIAKSHFTFMENRIIVKLSIFERFLGIIFIVLGITLIILSVIIILFYLEMDYKIWILAGFIMFLGIISIYSVRSIVMAMSMISILEKENLLPNEK